MTSPSLHCVLDASVAEAIKQTQRQAEATMTNMVLIERTVGVGPLNYATGLVQDQVVTVYSGIAAVGAVEGGTQVELGDEQEYWDHSLISIPMSAAEVKIDDIVTVTDHADRDVLGRKFRVRSVSRGGAIPSKYDLNCFGVAPSRGTKI